MLNKKFDMAIIGQSISSYLMALELNSKAKQVLLLDHEQKQVPYRSNEIITFLDKEWLRPWGEKKDIRALARIEDYLEQEDLYLMVDGKQVRLGRDVTSNVTELARKIPHFLKALPWASELENSFVPYINNLADKVFHFQGVESFRAQSFLVECPPPLKKFLALVAELGQQKSFALGEEEASNLYYSTKSFVFAARSYYQQIPWLHASELEAYHLACCLLGPCYKVDRERLLSDLTKEFKAKGGQIKRTQISDWQTHQNKPWALELSSFDGIIHPKRLALFGPFPSHSSLSLENSPNYYQALCWSLPLKQEGHDILGPKLDKRRVVWCKQELLGTDMPLLEYQIQDQQIVGQIICYRGQASKVSFHQKKALELIKMALGPLFIKEQSCLVDWSKMLFVFGPKLWPKIGPSEVGRKRKVNRVVGGKLAVCFKKEQEGPRPLGHVDYFGPLNQEVLGPLSHILDVKDFISFQ